MKIMAVGKLHVKHEFMQGPNHMIFRIVCSFICLLLASRGQAQDPGLVFSQSEEQEVGQHVGSASSSPVILRVSGQTNRTDLRYNILSDESDSSDLFKIEAISGNITFAKRVDREAVCPLSRACEVNLGVTVTGDNNFFTTIPVKVNILDVNDNSPTFPQPDTIFIHVSEEAPEHFTQALTIATDLDGSIEFGIASYSIDPPNDKFRLELARNFVGISQVSLVLTHKLDREAVDKYKLLVVATDGGKPPRSGTLTVNVVVDDANDNSPVFSEKYYMVNVSEEAESGDEILMVMASDMDIGDNGQIMYALSSVGAGNSADIMDKINVNSSTGVVTLKQRLANGEYKCLIEAHDLGSPKRYDQTVVSITVLDTVNSQPTVRVNHLQRANMSLGWVSEGSEVGTVVAVVTVDDPDSGSNGQVSCESLGHHFRLERMESRRFKLILARLLDRETNATITANVVCGDEGTPSLTVVTSIIINVFDTNDNPPQFSELSYVHGIVENNMKDDTVAVVNALDKDEGQNAAIEYRLVNDWGNFTITPDTGVIKASKRFDREEMAQYIFQVLAIDGGDPSLTGTAIVTINILDVNDVDPIFSLPKYEFHLNENSNSGSFVGNVTVADPDLGDGGIVSLLLKSSNDQDSVPFTISTEGIITTLEKLDRETNNIFSFYVVAVDNGNQKRTSSAEVVVRIVDVNDNRPIFAFPSHNNFSTYLNMPIQKDASILHLDVYDVDENQHGVITFSIVATNASELFRIGKSSGDVVANKYLNSRTYAGTYFITINATDQGVPVLSESRNLFIVLQSKSGSWDGVVADENVLIVACIVCLTVIVSGVVLVAICMVRVQDRRKKLHYRASISPDGKPDTEVETTEENCLQYNLEITTMKELTPQHDQPPPQYQQHRYNPKTTYHGSSSYKTDRTSDYSSDSNSRVPSPDRKGHNCVPSGHKHKIVEASRQRQDESTTSAEICTGDSGHGSDEEVTNNTEHANTRAGLREHTPSRNRSMSLCQLGPSLEIPGSRTPQHHLVLQPSALKNAPNRVTNTSLRFDPRVRDVHDHRQTVRTQSTHQMRHNSRNTNASAVVLQQQPRECTYFKQQQLQNRSFPQHSLFQYTPTLPSQHRDKKHPSLIEIVPARGAPSLSQSSMGDSYDDSDNNTTTSGSYSLDSDNTSSLYCQGQTWVKDMHI